MGKAVYVVTAWHDADFPVGSGTQTLGVFSSLEKALCVIKSIEQQQDKNDPLRWQRLSARMFHIDQEKT